MLYEVITVALFGYFALGWALCGQRDLLPALRSQGPRLLLIALITVPFTVWGSRARLIAQGDHSLLVGLVAGLRNKFV